LGAIRKLVKKALEENGFHGVEEDNFETDYRTIIDYLGACKGGRSRTCSLYMPPAEIVAYSNGLEPVPRLRAIRRETAKTIIPVDKIKT
jgi:hypothetical protein